MEKHATEDDGKTKFVMVCIQDEEAAKAYTSKHNLKNVIHLVAKKVPSKYGLKYIPHHVVIGKDGKVKLNYDKPSRNYMDFV